jgi:hypothetical protein
MRSKARSIGGRYDHAEIRERVANFLPLIEARTADHAIGQAQRDEALFKFAHLERGAHQNGDIGKPVLLAL